MDDNDKNNPPFVKMPSQDGRTLVLYSMLELLTLRQMALEEDPRDLDFIAYLDRMIELFPKMVSGEAKIETHQRHVYCA